MLTIPREAAIVETGGVDVPMSVWDASRVLGTCREFVLNALKRGDLLAYKVGRKWVIDEEDLDRFKRRCQLDTLAEGLMSSMSAGHIRVVAAGEIPPSLEKRIRDVVDAGEVDGVVDRVRELAVRRVGRVC